MDRQKKNVKNVPKNRQPPPKYAEIIEREPNGKEKNGRKEINKELCAIALIQALNEVQNRKIKTFSNPDPVKKSF